MPIYIHPHLAPEPVRQAYFAACEPGASRVLEAAGWGWHSEMAIHVLRLVLAGTLDAIPKLKLIIGHMGEMLPVMLARIDDVFALDIGHLKRPISRRSSSRSGSRPAASSPSRRSSPRCRRSASTASCSRSTILTRRNAKGRAFLDRRRARAGRHGQAHARQRRRAAEAAVGQPPSMSSRASAGRGVGYGHTAFPRATRDPGFHAAAAHNVNANRKSPSLRTSSPRPRTG